MATTVKQNGQITLPKAVRDHLGLTPGSQVDFRQTADGSVILLRKDHASQIDRFEKLRGHAGEGQNTDDIIASTRGEL
ncbi:AbrB/MazE/SpoVT family DNA-binding domain-containing protein [Rhizobium sp. SSA_523]|uniref:AbrB/MazE/SpoVT family DNA-binding domain-containing protein n=1 Tax=Rhizobium sp. SSA_523 TaxID=2952477 RepID=UPI002090A156|nr:AbrB/MazE/SpoVT family DNA-binding domain-containing protein [Rhizobium sp. SSA_523]MCO5730346.1 AbrB/MazE/SpoVT family DNA-binding domain-containing protein [Rhizobium sp. SSA_523]WKC25394.1 AbrB/MazE/SpoVT family DNA-binding domain-containing protein [Rhizobium sp. SSA_523]